MSNSYASWYPPPNDTRSKGRMKRIKGHADKGQQQNKNEQKEESATATKMQCVQGDRIAWSQNFVLRNQTKDELG